MVVTAVTNNYNDAEPNKIHFSAAIQVTTNDDEYVDIGENNNITISNKRRIATDTTTSTMVMNSEDDVHGCIDSFSTTTNNAFGGVFATAAAAHSNATNNTNNSGSSIWSHYVNGITMDGNNRSSSNNTRQPPPPHEQRHLTTTANINNNNYLLHHSSAASSDFLSITNTNTNNDTHILQEEDDNNNDVDAFDTTPIAMNYSLHSTSSSSSFKMSRRSSSHSYAASADFLSISNSNTDNATHVSSEGDDNNDIDDFDIAPLPMNYRSYSTSFSSGSSAAKFSLPPTLLSSNSSSKRHRRSMSIGSESSNSCSTSTTSHSVLDTSFYKKNNSNSSEHNKTVEEEHTDYHNHLVDELLAKELNQLSFEKRESINEEIHGIDVQNIGVKETPELLQDSFRQLDVELNKLRPDRVAYDRCQKLYGSTTYFNTEEMRIMFLRCDLFDCRKAANRLCDYAELMHDIYGDFALQRRPCLSDMSSLEREFLEAGFYQILSGRDRAGRRIVCNIASDAPKEFGVRSRCRLSVYVLMSTLEDVETQRKGIVVLSWWQNLTIDDFYIRGQVHKRLLSIPMRVGAFHCCIPVNTSYSHDPLSSTTTLSSVTKSSDPLYSKKRKANSGIGGMSSGMMQIVRAMYTLSIGPELRPHFRTHTGSVVECFYALQSFGLHSDQIPISSSNGKLKIKNHLKWLEFCRLKEDSTTKYGGGPGGNGNRKRFDKIIECPNQEDVLFGRGRPIMRHPGNILLRNIVQSKVDEYSNAKSKKGATDVTWSVVRMLKSKFGTRFLKEENMESDGLGWIEVSNDIARQKVRAAFRDFRTKMNKTTLSTTKTPTAATNSSSSSVTNEAATTTSTSTKTTKQEEEEENSVSLPSAGKLPSSTISSTDNKIKSILSLASSSSVVRQGSFKQQTQQSDSSTSAFLTLDGSVAKNRQHCFCFGGSVNN